MPENKDPKKDPNYSYFQSALKDKEPIIKDKARLYYYTQKFKEPLEKKNPKVYEELMSKYGWNPDAPLTSKTRTEGAKKFAKENPDFYLNPDEQKKVLGKDWDDYVKLRAKYGQELNILGENDDPNKPESWGVGARHIASFNPVAFDYTIEPPPNSYNPVKSNFLYNVKYDPSVEGDPYITNLNYKREGEEKALPQKVVSYYDNNDQIKTDKGVVFTTPGFKFKKINDDGTEEAISSKEYFKLKPINNIIDPNQKEKFLTDLGQ